MGFESGMQVRQRRILFAVLSPYMKRDALYSALWAWEDNHAPRPGASLHKFISSLCASGDLALRRLEINRALVETMQMKDGALGPDPMQEMRGYRLRVRGGADSLDSRSVGATAGTAATVVFEVVLRGFCNRLESQSPQGFPACVRYVVTNLPKLRLTPAAEAGLASFLRRISDRLSEAYGPETMQSLLHLLYVAACEFFGPVKADELLAAAVADAERTPEARLFPPRSLL